MSSEKKFRIHMILVALVLLGSINWGVIGVFNKDLTQFFTHGTRRIIYIVIGCAGLFLALERNTYLPFLGATVYPCSSLVDSVPKNADTIVKVSVPPGSKVVYWASEPVNEELKTLKDPWSAYNKFENTGIATASEVGEATLTFRKPQPYKVAGVVVDKVLASHVHYRYCTGKGGILSEVKTVFL